MAALLMTGIAVASAQAEETLATWTLDMTGFSTDVVLALKDGKPALHQTHSDGSGGWNEIAERPSSVQGTRRYDLSPGYDMTEYVLVAESGTVTYWSWEGRQFGTAESVVIHDAFKSQPEAAASACVPRKLSDASKRTIRLYERLQGFKDESGFARMGFSPAGPYNAWLKETQAFEREDSLKVMDDLNFLPGDLMMLGMNYMTVATRGGSGSDRRFIADTERTIKAGLALATCKDY